MPENLISNNDVVVGANEPIRPGGAVDDSGGDIILRTSGVERARIKADGTGSGWPSILGGSIPAIGNGSTSILYTDLWPTDYFLAPTVDIVVETIFASGHGFTKPGGATGTLVDDTVVFNQGTQSLKIVTNNDGVAGFNAARKTGMTALDATAKYLAVSLMVDRPDLLHNLRFDVSSDAFTNWSTCEMIEITTNLASPYFVPNQWTTVLIPWAAFAVGGGVGATRSALTGFQVRASDLGTGAVTVRVNKISTVAEPASGVLTFTFDDGYIGHYSKAKPYMDKYGFKGTFGPIIDLIGTGNATTGYMSTAQLLALRDDGWDCAVHAYTAATHNNYETQTDAQIETDVQQAKAYLRAQGLGPADTFLVPRGALSQSDAIGGNMLAAGDNRTQIWKRYFQTGRSSYQKVRETYPPARRLGLRCQSCDSGISAATVNAAIDEAVANKEWIILKTHNIVDASASGTDILTATFQSIVDHVATSGIKVRTLREVSNTGLT